MADFTADEMRKLANLMESSSQVDQVIVSEDTSNKDVSEYVWEVCHDMMNDEPLKSQIIEMSKPMLPVVAFGMWNNSKDGMVDGLTKALVAEQLNYLSDEVILGIVTKALNDAITRMH